MIALGVRFRRRSEMRDRAARLLSAGGLPTDTLAHHLFRLRQAVPDSLADRLLSEVLAADPEFCRDPRGLWRYSPAGAWPASVPLDELTYCVVDVETTGGAPWTGHRMIEVAAVKIRSGAVAEEFATLVDPQRRIPRFVTALTGITDAMVAAAPPFPEVAGRLREFLAGSLFVAHNAMYDWRFLEAETERACGLRMEGTRLCTLRLARRLYPELLSQSLGALAERFGIPLEMRHRATPDAVATAHVFLQFLRHLDGCGVTDWAGLQEYLLRRRDSGGSGRAPSRNGSRA